MKKSDDNSPDIKDIEFLKKIGMSSHEFSQMTNSGPWQNPGQLVFSAADFGLSGPMVGEKSVGGDLFKIKERCRKAYRESPHVGSNINRFSSWIWGDNSFVYSDYVIVQDFLDEFWSDWFNDLNTGVSEYVTNMLIEGESFPIVTIRDLKGTMTVRSIEAAQIRGNVGSNDEFGIITDPDDISVNAFYIVKANGGKDRLIPDINILWDPSLHQRVIDKNPTGFVQSKTKDAQWKGQKKRTFKRLTGTVFNQFIIPWKNLIGIKNQRRSVSSIRRAIESDNKYETMLNYSMDFFRASMSFTDVFEFTEDRLGIMAFNWIANKMKTKEGMKELYNTGILKPKAPGDTLITRPGMKYSKKTPNLGSAPMSGFYQDFLNRIGAAMEVPSDLVSSNPGNSTQAALKMSRQAPQLMVFFVQWRTRLFLRERFMRSIFKIKSMLDDKFPKTIPVSQFFLDQETGKDKEITRNLPLYHEEILKISTPDVDLGADERKVKAILGSKNIGYLDELSLSSEEAAKKLDIHNYTLQRRKRMKEDKRFGKKIIIKDKEQSAELSGTLRNNQDNNNNNDDD